MQSVFVKPNYSSNLETLFPSERCVELSIRASVVNWLIEVVQNPFYGQELGEEDEVSRKNREYLWNLLNKAKS